MLLGLYKLSVEEGSSVTITHDHFDSNELLQRFHAFRQDLAMTFKVETLPRHGELYLGGQKVSVGTLFSQSDVDSERLEYKHDDSDSLEDVLSFTVVLQDTGERDEGQMSSPKHVVNFTIEVVPVNDQQFTIVTQNPSLRVSVFCYHGVTVIPKPRQLEYTYQTKL
jgi:hypothetical protein